MKCCGGANKPWCISLLEYLATPLSTQVYLGLPSPAAMMGREFRGILPHLKHFLLDSTKEQLVHCHENQVCTGGHDLSEISIGSTVTFLDHRSGDGIQQKSKIELLTATSLQLNKDILFLTIMLILYLLM